MTVRAPFPWFGGKSRVASLVWSRFGDVPNYVEPFAGSLAVLLGRPTPARIETVNDLDAFLSNFWRAVQADPAAVAKYADWPVNEADLHARHRWLVNQAEFLDRMKRDPDFFDPKIAGWWLWGICQWIGSGWCSAPEWQGRTNAGRRSRGIATANQARDISNSAEWGKRPVLAHGNRGIINVKDQIPALSRVGQDITARNAGIDTPQRIPYLKSDGQGIGTADTTQSFDGIYLWMLRLQERLRRVRVCCGDWTRILGRSATELIGMTGVFLDPPYGGDADRDPSIYAHDSATVAGDVATWAIENGDNPLLRIALCGYEGEHEMPASWECVAWKAAGGYGSQSDGRGRENSNRERIWFSPACIRPERMLF